MAISKVASTRGVSLLPLYIKICCPKTAVSRPIQWAPPMVDLVFGLTRPTRRHCWKGLLSKVDELKV